MLQTAQLTFDQALVLLQSLSLEDQDALLEVIKQQRQAEFVAGVYEADKDFTDKRFVRGDAKTILKALQQ